jgi:hypothetical protein
MFNTIRQFVSLATYNADYDPEDEGASGNANIMEGVTTTNADIWPGGHGAAGWTNGSTVTVVRTLGLPSPWKETKNIVRRLVSRAPHCVCTTFLVLSWMVPYKILAFCDVPR